MALRENMKSQTGLSETERDRRSTTLAIQLLGATILGDTGVLGEKIRLERPSLDELITEASKKFDRYFKYSEFLPYFSIIEQAYQILQQICYAGFMPDMLRDLYKRAYTEEQRKESGSYDTPLHLTRRIWKNIPVEYIAPQNRIVADMTCGWGSFLVAGHERLAGLKDMEGFPLRDYLYGNDDALFTSQLAGLGLLLATSEDSWNIDQRDALEWSWLKENQPMVIVGNPPFSGSRGKASEEALLSAERAREEKANRFLKYAIERLAPRGHLAIIMPSTFTALEASPGYRKQLLEQCDVLELWSIPSGIFDAKVRATVIFAQKKSDSSAKSLYPVRVRTIQRHTLRHTDNMEYTASGLVTDQSSWNEQSRKSPGSQNTHIMDFTIILPEYVWQTIQVSCAKKYLSDYATIIRGAIVGQKPENKRWTNYPSPKLVPWLADLKKVMPPSHPFFLDYDSATTIIYPNDLEEPRKSENPTRDKEYILAGKKVLVPYHIDPSWGKRLRVVIERKGYYVSDNFYAVVPNSLAQRKYITHEVLAAVLNWDVSNAWVVEH